MEFRNRTFAFCRADNHVLIRNIVLNGNNFIDGRTHPNETSWEFKDKQLLFKNDKGEVTTTFHTIINLDGKLICLGRYGTKEVWHILVETNLNEQINFQTHINKIENLLGQRFTQIQNSLGDMTLQTKRIERNENKIKVVFLIHNSASWDSLHDVYQEMTKSEYFEVIVATIPRRFPGEGGFGHEAETHNFLFTKDIPHIRFTGASNNNLNILKYINPDAVFRQAPWDHDIAPEWSTTSLAFTNLFYIPYYGFNIIEKVSNNPNEDNIHANLAFHKSCAQIFFETELIKKMMGDQSSRGGDNFVATGHPKLERLYSARNRTPFWPINTTTKDEADYWPVDSNKKGVVDHWSVNGKKKKTTRIIWAPHHSFTGDGWFSFGLFQFVYKDMLAWAKESPDIEIVLKPHPALFTSMVGRKIITKEDFDLFMTEWNALPNTIIVEEGDYGPLMVGSDIMLTDGISFLAEYMLFWEKPLIFMKNKNHAKFNIIGQMIENAAYVADNVQDVQQILNNSLQNDKDPKKSLRKKVFEELMPFETGAAKRIAKSVKEYFVK